MQSDWRFAPRDENLNNQGDRIMQNNLFVGHVAAEPKMQGAGDKAVCRFTLMETDYAGTDKDNGEVREVTTAIQFVAFRKKAEAIVKNVRKGDQLIVNYRIRNNNYKPTPDAEMEYGFNFIVDDFEFGAPGKTKREEFEGAATE